MEGLVGPDEEFGLYYIFTENVKISKMKIDVIISFREITLSAVSPLSLPFSLFRYSHSVHGRVFSWLLPKQYPECTLPSISPTSLLGPAATVFLLDHSSSPHPHDFPCFHSTPASVYSSKRS